MERVARVILDRAAGRDIVIYGCGEAGELMFRTLRSVLIEVSFFVDRKYNLFGTYFDLPVRPNSFLDPEKHYVIINPSSNMNTIDSIKADLRSQCGYDNDDWFHWDTEINYDIMLNGVTIGRGTPIVDAFLAPSSPQFFESVGRYTSINSSLKVSFNHFIGLSTSFRVPNPDIQYQKFTKINRITIGHDVYIGANTFINASSVKSIGNGSIIATGAVVLEDVPPYAVVAGVPAKIKKYRFTQEQIDILERVQWWNWDNETMRANADCFSNPELFFLKFR
ncbi:hypothetical protein Elgi_54940 [Paenibacillus elgii]|uniref:CatB-related O-acetyltransferase n=1 Tax=Paenibacillus elgii TaxID=189691 RepID=UPI002D7C36D3|nr:hypothetical protein Elgi_54940 [Paenibacillus elgii]